MYLIKRAVNGIEYAYAAISYRNEVTGKVNTDVLYLGKVLDKQNSIFQSKDRGIFYFNIKNGDLIDRNSSTQYSGLSFHEILNLKLQNNQLSVLDFGDSFLIDHFITKIGFKDVIKSINYGNKDTLLAMVQFYLLGGMANYDAQVWYSKNFANLLYPNAALSSQNISNLLASLGSDEIAVQFAQAYVNYLQDVLHFELSETILDSVGLENKVNCSYSEVSSHNNIIKNEARILFVTDKTMGIPIISKLFPGNIVDVSTLKYGIEYLRLLGVNIKSCLFDAGFVSKNNLDIFYDDNHDPICSYLTRVNSNNVELKKALLEVIDDLDTPQHLVKYNDRYLFVVERQIFVGSNKNNPAYLYICLDCERKANEQYKLFKKAIKEGISIDELFEQYKSCGIFGLISNEQHGISCLLPSYYYRQNVEQTLDFYKNNTAVLPLRVHNDRTLKGHLLISFIALCIVKFLQVYLGTTDDIFGSKLKYLRNQKCLVIGGHVLIEPAQKYLNDIYKKLCIEVPTTIDIEKNGLAQLYSGSNEEDLDFLNKAVRKKQSKINPTNNTTNGQTSVTKGDTEQSRSTKDVSIISEKDA